jgi:hypothetical protein
MRQTAIVDEAGFPLYPGIGFRPSFPRVLSALPMGQARLVAFPRLLVSPGGLPLGDADGNVIGVPQLFVHRLVSALRV